MTSLDWQSAPVALPFRARLTTPRARSFALACGAALALTPAAAHAAVRIGPDVTIPPPSNSPVVACVNACGPVAFSAAAGVQLEAPSDGVITAVEHRGEFATTKVRVVKTSGSDVTFIRSGPTRTSTDGPIRSFAERLPIRAGERIALEAPANKGSAFALTGTTGRLVNALPADDTTQGTAPLGAFVPYVSALIEPDVDRDGFGDETQDQCPKDPTTQAPCPVTPVIVEIPGPTITQTLVTAAATPPGPVAGTPSVAKNRRSIAVPVICPPSRTTPCTGTISITTASAVKVGATRVAVELGSGAFSARPGSTPTARIALGAGARALLTPGKKLAITLSLRPADGPATSRREVLRLPKKRG